MVTCDTSASLPTLFKEELKKDLSPNAGIAAQAQQSAGNRGGRGGDRRRGGRGGRRENK